MNDIEAIVIVICIVVAAANIAWIGYRRKRDSVRGFEVKRNTGETPVPLDKKEHDNHD